MTGKTPVGFIGLGDQGAPIAARILDAGWPLHVWARRPASTADLVAAGATETSSPRELGSRCGLVGVCVSKDDDVRDVVLRDGTGLLQGMAPGSVLAIHSTVAPDTVIELAREAESRGVHLLDAPVSGGHRGAAAGTLTVMVGGDPESLATARPVFDTFATTVAHLGPVGAGQSMKLLNNILCYGNAVMSMGALDLAAQLGMDRDQVVAVIRQSSGSSAAFGIVSDDQMLVKASGPTSNVPKDVHHFLDLAARRGLPADPLTDAAATVADRLVAHAASRFS